MLVPLHGDVLAPLVHETVVVLRSLCQTLMDRIVDERAVLEKELALFLPEVALENIRHPVSPDDADAGFVATAFVFGNPDLERKGVRNSPSRGSISPREDELKSSTRGWIRNLGQLVKIWVTEEEVLPNGVGTSNWCCARDSS